MQASIKLGRVFGVEIGLHYSWLIIALLIVLSLAGRFFATNPEWGMGVIWGLAAVTALLFFVSLIVHEMSHALVAKASGLPVRSITLFALGGVAQIDKEATDAKTEFWVAIVGPITSVVIGIVCLGAASVLGWNAMQPPATPLLAMLVWLGFINVVLAVFNMIPGFPLDGGRVLRAVLWWLTGRADQSMRLAVRVGQWIAAGFIIFGLFILLTGGGFNGLWLAIIGWFLWVAAGASYKQVGISEALQNVRVQDVMTNDCSTIDGRSNLQSFADEHLLRSGRRCFIVEQDGRIAGLITPNEIKEIDRSRWSYTTVSEAMRPLDQLRTVSSDRPVSEALETMGRNDINQLPVVSNGRLQGIIARAHIMQFLQTRAELKA